MFYFLVSWQALAKTIKPAIIEAGFKADIYHFFNPQNQGR